MSAASIQDLTDYLNSDATMRPAAVASRPGPPAYPSESAAPSVEELQRLKEQLSVHAWLYLLHAADTGLLIDEFTVRRELQAHLARVLNLVGQHLRHEPLNSPQVLDCCRWVQHQLLHAPADQLPPVYYEQSARALINEARHQQALDRISNALNQEQQAGNTHELGQLPSTAYSAATGSSQPIPLAPRTSFTGSLQHPGFGQWLVQELAQRPLPEIEPYLTLTWVWVTPDSPRRAGDSRRVFTLEDVPYLLDLLEGDWSFLTTGGRPQIDRARTWFARHQSVVAELAPTLPMVTGEPTLTLRQLALQAIYEEHLITLQKAHQIAQQWGHQSGGRLYQLYRKFLRPADRLGRENRELVSLIKDIEAVLPRLTAPARKRAEEELLELLRKK